MASAAGGGSSGGGGGGGEDGDGVPSSIFSVRIVSIDYYMAPPIPGFDLSYSDFQGRSVTEVPVIRIYGSTPAGQKTCMHVHRALPYLYIPCPEIVGRNPEEGNAYMRVLSRAVEKALTVKHRSATKRQHVHGCSVVRAKKFYGFHSSEDLFLKIYLYYPTDVSRLSTLLLESAILNKILQPYESHIPFLLQFLVDCNLHGMSYLHASKVMFRPPLPDVFPCNGTKCNKDGLKEVQIDNMVQDPVLWLSSTTPSSLVWPSGHNQLPGDTVRRHSLCCLEVDSVVEDILNQENKMYTSLSQTRSEVKMVQSLVPIWEEESSRLGMDVVQSADSGQPCPEDVLRNFLHGVENEMGFSDFILEIKKSSPLPISEADVVRNAEMSVKSYEERNGDACFPAGSSVAKAAVPCYNKSSELAAQAQTDPSPEAVGLLSWLASSQGDEELNTDDVLVHEAILSPLLCQVFL